MSYLTDVKFWKATGERAVKTVAQSAIAAIGTTLVLHEVDWLLVGSTAGLAGVISVLMSLGSGALTTDGGPSLTSESIE